MKTIILELPEEDYAKVEEAFCHACGYEETHTLISRNPFKEEKVPNPQSKEAFVVEKIVNYMLETVRTSELQKKKEEARKEVEDMTSKMSITHKPE